MYSCTCIIMISLHYNNVIEDLFIGRTIFLPKTSLRPVPGDQFCSAIINHTLWCPWCHFSAYSMTRTAYQVQKALQWLCRRKAISNYGQSIKLFSKRHIPHDWWVWLVQSQHIQTTGPVVRLVTYTHLCILLFVYFMVSAGFIGENCHTTPHTISQTICSNCRAS